MSKTVSRYCRLLDNGDLDSLSEKPVYIEVGEDGIIIEWKLGGINEGSASPCESVAEAQKEIQETLKRMRQRSNVSQLAVDDMELNDGTGEVDLYQILPQITVQDYLTGDV